MSYETALKTIDTQVAGADLSAKQYYIVKTDSAGAVVLAGDGEVASGVLQNKPTSGQAASYAVDGVSKVVVSGAITAGGLVMSDSNGKGTAHTGSGKNAFGRALETSTTDGDIIAVQLNVTDIA